MKLVLIRHGEAEDQAAFARVCPDDRLRPLTGRGRKEMKKIARGLASMVSSFDTVGTSPLRRAVQTAELVCEAYGGRKALEIPELSPGGRPAAMVGWLGRQKRDASIALVGHEPDLAVLASWLMTGRKGSVVQLKKGAGCMLDLGDDPGAGKARLQWLLTPEQLTRLGR